MTTPFPYAGMYGPQAVLTALGVPVPSAAVNVYLHGTLTAASLFTDQTGATVASNPVTTDGYGNLTFFAAPGQYDIAFTAGGVPTTLTVQVNRWYADEAPYATPSGSTTGATGTLTGTVSVVPTGGGTTQFLTGGVTKVTTPNNGLLIPAPGNYLIIVGLLAAMPSGGAATLYVAKNGGTTAFANTQTNGTSGTISEYVRAEGILACAANDIVGAMVIGSGSMTYTSGDISAVLVSA